MTIYAQKLAAAGGIARLFGHRFGPQIMLDKETGDGSGGGAGDGEGDASDKDKTTTEETQVDAGKEKLSDKEADLLKEVMDKKAKLKDAEKTLADLSAKLKDFDGIDPVAVRKLLEDQRNAEKTALEAKGEWDRLKTMMAEDHKRQLDAVTAEMSAKETALQKATRTINDLTVGSAFSHSSFVADNLVLTPAKARTVYGAHFEVEDGKVVAYDKPAGTAERTKLVNAAGDPLGFEDAIKKLVEADPERDRMVRSKIKDGAGSSTSDVKTKVEPAGEAKGVHRIAAILAAKKSAGK